MSENTISEITTPQFPITATLMKKYHMIAAIIIIISASTTLFHLRDAPKDLANPLSRYATVVAIVDHGTFAINKTPYTATMDRIKKDGKLYSSKPPVLSTMVAFPYWIQKTITGNTARNNETSAIYWTTFLSIFLLQCLALIFFWRFSLLVCTDPRWALLNLTFFGLTWIGAAYATDMNNHSVAGALAIFSFYTAYRLKHNIKLDSENSKFPKRILLWILAGLFSGFLATVTIPLCFFSLGIFFYLSTVDLKKTLSWFMLGALPPLTLHFTLTYKYLGSVLPAYMQHALYEKHLTEWDNRIPFIRYTFHSFLGHHGVFSMTPILLFGFIGLFYFISRGKRNRLFGEALFSIFAFLAISLLYMNMNRNYGGVCFGFRWLLSASTLLFLFAAPFLEELTGAFDRSLLTLKKAWVPIVLSISFLVGIYNVQNALDNPWRNSHWYETLTGNHRFQSKRPFGLFAKQNKEIERKIQEKAAKKLLKKKRALEKRKQRK